MSARVKLVRRWEVCALERSSYQEPILCPWAVVRHFMCRDQEKSLLCSCEQDPRWGKQREKNRAWIPPQSPFASRFFVACRVFSCKFPHRGACSQAKHSITSLCFSTPPLLKLWWLPSVLLLEDIWHHLLVLVFLPKLYATGS